VSQTGPAYPGDGQPKEPAGSSGSWTDVILKVIAFTVVSVLFLVLVLPIIANIWISSVQEEITSEAEQQIMDSFQQGSLQIISAYECEEDILGCKTIGNLCFLVRNTGNTVVRLSDLGSAMVTYELPGAPEAGERPLMSKYLSGTFGEEMTCCLFSDMSADGTCGEKKVIESRETFITGFNGDFEDSAGASQSMSYSMVKEQQLIISMNLPSGFKITHQVV